MTMSTSHLQLNKDTLLIIPSSKSQSRNSESGITSSILSSLDPENAKALIGARMSMHQRAHIDETTHMPAYRRFKGTLYEQCSESLGKGINAGQKILIVTGAYGVVVANEPIGFYERQFSLSDWQPGLLGRCIIDYIKHSNIKTVIAVASFSTSTATLIRSIKWKLAGVEACLVTPNASGAGVLTKVPRTQGEAIKELIEKKRLERTWISSDSLSLKIQLL